MVSLHTILAAGTIVLAALAHASPTPTPVRRADSVCGTQPAPGIRQPANGTKITWTAAEQANSDGHAIEIVYCSGEYFKTSSVNVTVLLGAAGTGSGAGTSGQILGSATPTGGAASSGYYGYVFNMTVEPASGNFFTGPYQLSVFEWATGEDARACTWMTLMRCAGYYNPFNYRIDSVTVDFEKAPTS